MRIYINIRSLPCAPRIDDQAIWSGRGIGRMELLLWPLALGQFEGYVEAAYKTIEKLGEALAAEWPCRS